VLEFLVTAALMIASAIWCISARKPVYSVVALLLNFALLAGMYLSLNAEFLAMIQIIVYSGAILILFLFVIALLSSGVAPFAVGPNRLPKIGVPAVVIAAVALAAIVFGLTRVSMTPPATAANGSSFGLVGQANVFGSVADFGKALFTTYLLPFEITALILMVAVIAVIVLVGTESPYVPSRARAAEIRREMREAILREGD
jgi:NADH-quinone oxidoreductase subunit J